MTSPRRWTSHALIGGAVGIDKKTGKRIGSVAVPRVGGYGLMTYLLQGKQYVVIPINGGYTTLALP